MSEKMGAGAAVPAITVDKVGGGKVTIGGARPGWQLVVVYRGKHCPICRVQLGQFAEKLDELTKLGVEVVAISMDDADRAKVVHEEWDTGDLRLGYGLSEADARALGLFLSDKRAGSEEPEVFCEPGLFLVRPDGTLFLISVQNVPFARPPLAELMMGINYVLNNDYPVRGSHD